MEKFSQFRDRGSGIAPFLPVPSQPICCNIPLRVLLFFFRLPLFIFACAAYFLILQWLPIGSLGKKAALWCILGIPSIWWIDLEVDGVRKGSLSRQQHQDRLPGPGTVIASSFTSPIDAVYLAAIFDPIFVACYPSSKKVQHISLLGAILRSFAAPQLQPPEGAETTDLASLAQMYPHRPIVAFAECTTTNARGTLPLSPALVGVGPGTKIFPVSLRYTPVDVVTPLPGCYLSFLWALLSKPTHCIRVRIAEAHVSSKKQQVLSALARSSTYDTNFLDFLDNQSAAARGQASSSSPAAAKTDDDITASEQAFLNTVGDSLARLGRVRRVGLGVKEKQDFVRMWKKTRWIW